MLKLVYMQNNGPDFEFDLPVSFISEGTQVVAYTPALDLSTTGNDETEARKNFAEIVAIFFEDLIENGNMEAVLYDLGWKKVQSTWEPPFVSQTSIPVRISIPA